MGLARAEAREESSKVEIERVWKDNYRVYGARKVWLALNREGHSAPGARWSG